MTKLTLFALSAALSAQTVVIKNATVHTITQGTLPGTSVVVKDGKIAEISANVLVPPGASVVSSFDESIIKAGPIACSESRPCEQDHRPP